MPRVSDWECIYRTPTGYLVSVQVRPLPRRTKRFPHGTKLETMQRWRDGTRADLELERDRARLYGTDTLAQDVEAYLGRWGHGKHPQTVAQRTAYLHAWAEAFRGRRRASLTTSEIEAHLAAWQRAEGFGANSWNKRRQAIYQLFAVLDRGAGRVNPVADVPTQEEPKAQPRGLPMAVVRAILDAMPRSRTRARLGVMAFTGLRPEELRRVVPGDIDWKGRALYVRTAKGGHAATLPLVPEAIAWLREFVAVGAFGGFTSAPMGVSLGRAVARVNLERLAAKQEPIAMRAYDMRHSFGTFWYTTTRDLKSTREAMRNTLKMTERYVESAVSSVLLDGARVVAAALAADTQSDTHGGTGVAKNGGKMQKSGPSAKAKGARTLDENHK